MGMSASQARYLNLIGRQNDLEFQGQQINQSRTTLSDQTNNLYSQLQNMDVPTPPVTSDYTEIVYSTSDGAVDYTLGLVRPSTKKEGAYNMDLNFSTVGDSLAMSNVSSSVEYENDTLDVTSIQPKVNNVPNGQFNQVDANPEFYITAAGVAGADLPADANLSNYMVMDTSVRAFVQASGEVDPNATYFLKTTVEQYNALTDAEKANYVGVTAKTNAVTEDIVLKAEDLSNYYVRTSTGTVQQLSTESIYVQKNEDGTYKVSLDGGVQLYKLGGSETIPNPNPDGLKIGGNNAKTYSDAFAEYGDKINWGSYESAIRNSFGEDAKLDDFYYVITPSKSSGSYDVKLYKKEDVPTTAAKGLNVKGYSYETGTYTASQNVDYVDIKFDSSGRISKITIPTEYNENGEPVSWKELDVESKTQTNNAAYEEAMTKYEYKKYKYDQEQTEINAKMSIIQAQDKKLELKLQRLDNERTQITTEIEALDKVINDNIEASYKTFSG